MKTIEETMSKPEKKIKVTFIRQTVAGGETARVGDVATLPESEANYLVSIGKAVVAPADAKEIRQGKAKPAAISKDKKTAE